MTDTMTSQNIDLSSWDTLYIWFIPHIGRKINFCLPISCWHVIPPACAANSSDISYFSGGCSTVHILMKQIEKPTGYNKVILLMYSLLDMFRVHTPIIRSIICSVAACGFVHRVFGWVVVCTVWMVPCGTIRTINTNYTAPLKTTIHPKTRCRNHMLQINI